MKIAPKIKLGIIGLGLMGASLLKALARKKEYEIYCVSNSSFEKARKYSKIASKDIKTIKDCDIIFVCCDISKTIKTLDTLSTFLNKKTIVADICSIKKNLLNKSFNFNFILSHPMAGSEKQGFDSADKNLYKETKWLVGKNNKLLNKVIKDTGAISYKIDMKNHDNLCAQISHLPAIISFLLFQSADTNALKIASSGFRDTTRLACNAALTFNMYKNNEENILKTFDKLTNNLNSLKKLSDNEKISLFNKAAKKRIAMYDENGKNTL